MRNRHGIIGQTFDKVTRFSRAIQKTTDDAEALLWGRLRGEQLMGFNFTRQELIQAHVVDFYCPACKLVVELDASTQETRYEINQSCDEDFSGKDFWILRYSSQEIITNLSRVVDEISCSLIKRRLQI